MSPATASGERLAAGTRIRWGRVAAGAVLLEVVLFVVLVPLMMVIETPFTPGVAANGNFTPFFAAVWIGCFVVAYACGMWTARGLTSGRVLHGALVGVLATVLYLALAAAQPGGVSAVAAAYGPLPFVLANGLRIAGAILGAMHRR